MNQTQLKYARDRATKILARRTETLKASFTVPAVKLSCLERLEALKAGKFKVDTKKAGDNRVWWHSGVTFTAERAEKFDKKRHDAALAALNADYEKLIDELVLGDNEQALALLKAFETE